MIFRPALWQIHFNLFQPPWNPPKQNLKIPKTPSKESSNKEIQKNIRQINILPSCQACLPYERLFQGETDGSSFPNGGLRVTHSAAAFTTWDRASPPFVMDKRHGRWQWIRPGSGKMWESIRKICHKNVEKCDYLHVDRNRYMIIICLDADIIWYDSCRALIILLIKPGIKV